jgi:hypothetical protein
MNDRGAVAGVRKDIVIATAITNKSTIDINLDQLRGSRARHADFGRVFDSSIN